jgi:hypothetical protein
VGVLVRGDTASALNISLGSVQVSCCTQVMSVSCQFSTMLGLAGKCIVLTAWFLQILAGMLSCVSQEVNSGDVVDASCDCIMRVSLQVLAVQQIGSRQLLVNVSAALPVSTDQAAAAAQQDLSAGEHCWHHCSGAHFSPSPLLGCFDTMNACRP